MISTRLGILLIGALASAGCVSTQTAMTGPDRAHLEVKGEGLAFRDQAQPQFYAKAAEMTLQAGKKCFLVLGQQTFDGAVDKPVTTHVSVFGASQSTVSIPTQAFAGDIQMFDKCDGSQIDAAAIAQRRS